MDKIIHTLFFLGFKFHPARTRSTLIRTYVQNYNGVRHWAEIHTPDSNDVEQLSIRMFSFREGTGDDEPIFDTGLIPNPTNLLIEEAVKSQKELM